MLRLHSDFDQVKVSNHQVQHQYVSLSCGQLADSWLGTGRCARTCMQVGYGAVFLSQIIDTVPFFLKSQDRWMVEFMWADKNYAAPVRGEAFHALLIIMEAFVCNL